VEQAHRKRPLIFGSQGHSPVLEELTQVRPQFDHGGGLTPAGGARFDEHPVGDFAGTAEELGVGEAVIAPETPDSLALIGDEGQRSMRTYGVAE